VLTLPSETYIAEQLDVVDPQRVHAVREAMREQLARPAGRLAGPGSHQRHRRLPPRRRLAGRRALAGLALSMLCLAARHSGDTVWPGKAYQRFKDAGNMTDRFNALAPWSSGHELAARRWRASTRCSSTMRWSSTSGLPCRPAPRPRRQRAAPCAS
jgi:aminopeptidase N